MMQYSWPSMLGCHAWLLIIANISTDSSCNDMVISSQDKYYLRVLRPNNLDMDVKIEPLL